MTTLSPLRTLAWGVLLVVVDVRVQAVDLVPDPIGWVLALAAAVRLAALHDAFRVTAGACAVGLVCSLPDWVGIGGEPLALLVGAVETVVVFATCTALMALLPARRDSANTLRWWDLALTAALVLVGWYAADSGPGLGPVAILLVLTELVVLVCFLVLLFRAARDLPPGPEKTLQKLP